MKLEAKPRRGPLPIPDVLRNQAPVIAMQDLEHNPAPLARVSNAGLKVAPPAVKKRS
jgi:hypothetical protein